MLDVRGVKEDSWDVFPMDILAEGVEALAMT